MKIIEALKEKKELVVKAQDLREKIKKYSAHLSVESPAYEDQKERVSSWLQGHQDIVRRIRLLSVAIQRTNLNTQVRISIGGEPVTLSIAEWVLRRRELAGMEQAAWGALTDMHLREQHMKRTDGAVQEIKVIRYFDPAKRDEMVDAFKHEPGLIDRTLEVVNASTEVEGI